MRRVVCSKSQVQVNMITRLLEDSMIRDWHIQRLTMTLNCCRDAANMSSSCTVCGTWQVLFLGIENPKFPLAKNSCWGVMLAPQYQGSTQLPICTSASTLSAALGPSAAAVKRSSCAETGGLMAVDESDEINGKCCILTSLPCHVCITPTRRGVDA